MALPKVISTNQIPVMKMTTKPKATSITVIVLIFILQTLSLHQTEGFNLCKNRSAPMSGPSGSKFGYSVTLWSDKHATKRLVIGAPRGKNHPEMTPNEYELGNIFLCDMESQCFVHQQVPYLDKDDNQQALNFGSSMRKYGMGFGEALSSLKKDNSPLAACAPRYPRRVDKELQSRGACFILQDADQRPVVIVPNTQKSPHFDTVQNAMVGFSAALINGTVDSLVMGGPLAFKGEGYVVNKPIEGTSRPPTNRISNRKTADKDMEDSVEGWQVAQGKFNGNDTSIVASAVNYVNKGRVRIYPKNMNPNLMVPGYYLREILGQEAGAKFGYSLGVGDFNNDGVDDLLVGAPWAPVHKSIRLHDVGKVHVYYAPLVEVKVEDSKVISGTVEFGNFGISAAGLGDINRDGYDDAAIAAPHAGPDGEGIVYIYSGSKTGLIPDPTQVLRGSEFSQGMRGFGFSLDGGIDMDSNGYPDVIIGAVESNEALFIRSAPVLTLIGSVRFETENLKVDNKTCDMNAAGNKIFKGVCFYLNYDLRYKSLNMTDPVEIILHMELLDQPDPPQSFFKVNNSPTYTRRITINSIAKKRKRYGETIFTKSDRSVIGKPVKASVSVSLSSSAESPDDATALDLALPPVLDILNQTYFNTSVVLTCDDNQTCFSKPDMAISAFPAELTVGQESLLALKVLLEVRNDPAYQVQVTVNHPSPLKYVRVEGDSHIPECTSNRLVGMETSTKFICTFKFVEANDKVNFTLIFAHAHKPVRLMEYLKEKSKDHLTINLKVHSDSTDTDERDNTYVSRVQVKTFARLYAEGQSQPETMAKWVNQTQSIEKIKEALPPYNRSFPVSRLGPMIIQNFSLFNRGPSPVKGAKVTLELSLFQDDNRVIYLFEKPYMSPGITCDWPTINPWNLQAPQAIDPELNSTEVSQDAKTRKRRQVDEEQETFLEDPSLSKTPSEASTENPEVPGRNSRSPEEPENVAPREYPSPRNARSFGAPAGVKYMECNSPKCAISCEVALLKKKEGVHVVVPGYLVIASLDQVGHKKLGVRSWIIVKVDQNGSIVINQRKSATTFVTLVKPPERGLSAVPFWLLLLAVLGSILFIMLIVALLWKAGFFKRKRPQTNPNRKSLVKSDYPSPEKDLQEIAPMQD